MPEFNERDIPKKYVKMYARAMRGKSRKAAMRMQCVECMGYVESEVELCTDPGCPLYPYRSPKIKASTPT